MKYLISILFYLLSTIENTVFCQKFPQETIVLESTIKVLQDAKKGGSGSISGTRFFSRGTLKEIIGELKGTPRSQTIEKGHSTDYLFRDSNSLVEVRMQTVFNQKAANLMLDQLQFRFDFSLDTVKIDTLAWVISSPTKLTDSISRELDKEEFGFAQLDEYCNFMEEIIVLDSSVDKKIQVSGENYDPKIVFDYLRKKYGYEIIKKKCTLDFLVIHYHENNDTKKYNKSNVFNRQ